MTVTQRYPPFPVAYRRGQNLKPGLAELVQQSAGMLATLDAHTQGASSIAAHAAPPNPSGERGHDHSGGEYGVPLIRSVASVSCSGALADVFGDSGRQALSVPGAAGGETNRSQPVSVFEWVPPCPPVDGAYLVVDWFAAVRYRITNLASSDIVRLLLWNLSVSSASPAVQVELDLPNDTGTRTAWSDSDTRLPLAPGRLNVLGVQLEVDRNAGGDVRWLEAQLDGLEFGVVP